MDGITAPPLSLSEAARLWREEQDWLPNACPHEPVDGTELCLFHTPPARYADVGLSEEAVAESLRSSVCSRQDQQKCFIGAELKSLVLAGERIPATDNRPLDFRLATITESVDCRDTDFATPITMVGADFCSEVGGVTTETGAASNRYISVDGDIDFSGAQFEDSADFKHAQFRSATTYNDAQFDDVVMFNYATFYDQFELWSTITGKADFSKARLCGTAQLRGTYRTAGIFNYTSFEGDVILWNSTFEGKAEFLAAEFGGTLDATHAEFNGVTRFCETAFTDSVILNQTAFTDTVRFRRIRAPNDVINLRQARLAGGQIELGDSRAHFDLQGATIGNISLDVTDTASLPARPFDYLRINRTTFEGFDFSRHAGGLKPDWRLDSLVATWPEQPKTESALNRFEALEDTYLRAKSGATEAGHNKAASEFFVHEMRYRRKQYPVLFRDRLESIFFEQPATVSDYLLAPLVGSRRFLSDISRTVVPSLSPKRRRSQQTPVWQSSYRWVSNATLGAVAGYGERPQRPLVSSLVFVCLCAVGYWSLGIPPTADAPFGLGYLLLSLQSFVTFILGSTPVETGFAPQLLSTVEGFVGAFLIAVFVFTLTRSIHR
jgi:uncharacterized protein YjbI with pentapeptide repeats